MSNTYVQKDMTGSIFRNPDKEEGDKRPNATGHALIDGRKIKISAWTRDGKSGKFQSLAFTWADEAPARKSQSYSLSDLDDEIPFG